ncbi:MAG: hypothetical protein J6Z30_03925 [Pyramidobacter sp.]|nr:hypothetical protein [Pyramidobacter sp.]
MNRKIAALCAVFAVLAAFAQVAAALTVGTFHIDDFHVAGSLSAKRASAPYDQRDMRDLAKAIRKSRAAALALQDVEGDAAMRYLAVTALSGWKYAGNDTASASDLYFLWDPRRAELKGTVRALTAGTLPRAPLAACFRDPVSDSEYTLLNAHLDNAAATEQMKELYRLAKKLPMPVVLLGCFGDPTSPASDMQFRKLERGYSCDDARSNPDFVAVLGLPSDQIGTVKETETAIRRRTSRRRERPSHDIITVELLD